jgi:hypothetical protein
MILAINAEYCQKQLTGDKKCVWCVVGTDVLQYNFGEFQSPDRSRSSVLGIATSLRA